MATQPDLTLELVSLSSVPSGELLDLLREERAEWKSSLLWHAGDVTEVLEFALTAGLLRGFGVLVSGRLVAYLSCHVTQETFRICTAFCRSDAPPAAAELLVTGALREAARHPGRVEAQLTAFWAKAEFDRAFAGRGFVLTPRAWLVADLQEALSRLEGAEGAVAWQPRYLEVGAKILTEAHEGTVEADINESFRSEKLAIGYLRDIVAGPGCGRFLPSASSVVQDDGELLGFALMASLGADVAHLPQIAVSPAAQGRALGRALLARSFSELLSLGHRRVTLSVSSNNQRAVAWYQRLGFTELVPFSSYHHDSWQ